MGVACELLAGRKRSKLLQTIFEIILTQMVVLSFRGVGKSANEKKMENFVRKRNKNFVRIIRTFHGKCSMCTVKW